MDSMELLRTRSDEQPDPDAVRMTAIRRRLEQRMDAERTAPARRRASVRPGLAGLVGGCAAVIGLMAVLVTAAPVAPAANASEVLQRAAQRASSSTLAGAGTVVEFTSRSLDQIDADAQPGSDLASSVDRVTLLKIPVGEEAWVRKSYTTVVRFAYGDEAQMPKSEDRATKDDPSFQSSKIGAFVNNPPSRASASLGDYPATIRDLPRDPDALLKALRDAGDGPGKGTGWQVLRAASVVLTSGVADSSLQTAVFTALQKMPDLTIVDTRTRDLDGRIGVAIGLKPGAFDPSKIYDSTQLLIDPSSGQYLGERTVSLHAYGVVPAGAELSSTAMRTDVATSPGDWAIPAGDRMFTYP